jgi:hypothetical protein
VRLYKTEAVSRLATISLQLPASAPAAAFSTSHFASQMGSGGMTLHVSHNPSQQKNKLAKLQDTAELQIQVLDGDKLLHSEDVTLHDVALMTAAENSWKVRVLEAVPGF